MYVSSEGSGESKPWLLDDAISTKNQFAGQLMIIFPSNSLLFMAQKTRPLCIKSLLYSNTCVLSVCLSVCLYVCNTTTLKRLKIGFQDQLSLNTGQKYCRIKLPFVIKIFVLSILSCHFT